MSVWRNLQRYIDYKIKLGKIEKKEIFLFSLKDL